MSVIASNAPTLFLGQGDVARLLRAGDSYLDGGVAYNVLARTRRLAPAGAGGECLFTSFYVVSVHDAGPVTFRVTPLVDGAVLESTDLVLPLVAERTTLVHEVAISIPYLVAGVEMARFAARGTWIQAQVETSADGVATFLSLARVDAVEVEYEVVRETQVAA